MTRAELVELARFHLREPLDVSDDESQHEHFERAEQMAHSILALLTCDQPCSISAVDVVNVDSDGYVTIYEQQSLRADDEAHWCVLTALDAVMREKERKR